ncbi:hypothetical protein, partial [Lonsdalea iberica]|uniref:hypothetical protein n=1 Tax=Lonsdalea iberica TaxID=1082703 RepID=UPI001C39135A
MPQGDYFRQSVIPRAPVLPEGLSDEGTATRVDVTAEVKTDHPGQKRRGGFSWVRPDSTGGKTAGVASVAFWRRADEVGVTS